MQKKIISKIMKLVKLTLLSSLALIQGLNAYETKAATQTTTPHKDAQKTTHVTTHHKETPAAFKTKTWTENADILNLAMELNPNGMEGIFAMYKSRFQATHALENHPVRTPDGHIPSITEKLHALVTPVKAFLPQVKAYKDIVKPLIETSLNRAYTTEETEKFAAHNAPLSFETSIFKRFLNAQEDFDTFMTKTITTEAEYLTLCKEFQRVFTDLLEHAFPNLTKKFVEAMAEKQKQAHNATHHATPAA